MGRYRGHINTHKLCLLCLRADVHTHTHIAYNTQYIYCIYALTLIVGLHAGEEVRFLKGGGGNLGARKKGVGVPGRSSFGPNVKKPTSWVKRGVQPPSTTTLVHFQSV